LIEEMGLKRVLRMFHQLNLQFVSNDQILRDPGLYGHLFEEVTPEDIRAEVTFRMIGISEMVGAEAKINQAISFMGVFGKVLSGESISEIAKMVWKLMGFDPDKINLQGVAAPPQEGGIVDPNLSSAVNGQAQNQGAATTPAVPGAGSAPNGGTINA
jgi:hypothetical protein